MHALWRVSVLGKGAWSRLPSSVCSAVAFALPLCKLHLTWLCLLMGLCPRLVAWRCVGPAHCTCCLVACPRPLRVPAFTLWAPLYVGVPLWVCPYLSCVHVQVTPRLCCAVLTAFSRHGLGLDGVRLLRPVPGWAELAPVGCVAVLLVEVYVIAGMVSTGHSHYRFCDLSTCVCMLWGMVSTGLSHYRSCGLSTCVTVCVCMLWSETVCWCVVCVVCACSVCMHVWCVSGHDWGVHGVIVGESVVGP